jgi:hypothetical protein
MAPFIAPDRVDECREFILPLICGFIDAVPLPFADVAPSRTLDGHAWQVVLVSRMSRNRVGTRYTRRGLDRFGHAAIHVETELLLLGPNVMCSHVQVRASLPAFWRQQVTLDYKPPIDIAVR